MSNIQQLTDWHKSLALVLTNDFNSDAMAVLLKGLEKLIGASSGMITTYPLAQPPQTSHHRLLANENPQQQIDTYDAGAYLLDPFYRIAFDQKAQGPFRISDISPEGFQACEYYNLFYKALGFIDEVCLLFQCTQQTIVSISLVRHAGENLFTNADINQLSIVYPLVDSIVKKWRLSLEQTSQPNLEWQLEHALNNFGTSVLTAKESKIIHLILHGYSIKSIATKLENSVETIKHHRKNIYSKLDVSSQSELFYLFIASLKAMPDGILNDPLTFL